MASRDQQIPDLLGKIDTILQESIAAGIPGISAAISTGKGNWTFTAGVADLESLQPIEPTNIFGIGSITKVFVAVVVLQLVEESKLQLSDPVDKYFGPEIWKDIDNAQSSTIRSLLNHTSGIDSWEDDPIWIRNGRGADVNTTHIWEKTETLEYIRRPKKTAPDPGTWGYANTNYTILGLIVEKVTGKTLEAEVRRRILEPLDMPSTFFEGFEQVNQSLLPHRYHWATETFKKTAGVCPKFPTVAKRQLVDCTSSNLSVSWAAGGMLSSPSNLLKFTSALREPGRILNRKSLAVLTEWQPTGVEKLGDMGQGLFRMKHGEENKHWLGHYGGVLGFSAGLFWAEKTDCSVCVLSNVGSSHAGVTPSNAGKVISDSSILELALQLASM